MNQFAVALQSETAVVSFGATKSGKSKQGSLARAIVFMNKQERMTAGQAIYAKWFANGQYRPLVEDILRCGLISEDSIPFARTASGITAAGPIPKERLIDLCAAVEQQVRSKIAKRRAKDNYSKEEDAYLPKVGSDKRFVFELVRSIASGRVVDGGDDDNTVDAE